MKELSIEEKAKAYDVAIERAKSFIENGDETERTISESIFAGLMNVSEDENIRKELIECLKHNALGYSEQTRNKWFAWLEKHGEQKSNPYSGTSFEYNGHIWGMCARDNGVDILLDSQLLKHFEKQGEQKANEIRPIFRVGDYIKNKKTNDKVVIEQLNVESEVYYYTSYDGAAVNHSDFPFSKQDEWELIGQKVVEQNHTDKVEPKFKAGNWYICVKDFYGKGVRFDKGYAYHCGLDGCLQEFDSGAHIAIDESLYDYFNLWTIQDAKAGDVLADDHHILILKELFYAWSSNGTPYSVKAYCGIKPNGNFEIGKDNWCFCGTLHIHPATKEQRDKLEKAMANAGYRWNKEELKLEKI